MRSINFIVIICVAIVIITVLNTPSFKSGANKANLSTNASNSFAKADECKSHGNSFDHDKSVCLIINEEINQSEFDLGGKKEMACDSFDCTHAIYQCEIKDGMAKVQTGGYKIICTK